MTILIVDGAQLVAVNACGSWLVQRRCRGSARGRVPERRARCRACGQWVPLELRGMGRA